jgi:DNA-binding FrmR family transcriptional regulator
MTKPGYTEDKQRLQDRLSRIEGQVRGVQRMVEEDRYCIDVLTQISAIRAALDKVALSLVDDHARNCMSGTARGAERRDQVDELMGALDRLLTR